MRKKTIAILLSIGFGLGIIGFVALIWGSIAINAVCNPDCTAAGQVAPTGPSIAVIVGLLLAVVGTIVGIVSWVGALVKQAREQQWGWFAGTLISGLITGFLTSICMLIYLIVVPEKLPSVPTYLPPSPYQPGMPYAPMPSYQPVNQYPSSDPYQAASQYPPVDPYQPIPQYPPVDPYTAPPQYPPQG